MKMATLFASPLTPTPLPRGERGFEFGISNSVPSPLEGEGQGEGASMQHALQRHHHIRRP
ncbi:MAG: hypothetical protein BWY86_01178 [Candidatus Aminicenantes bacterium ADurb.Bin508]|nr:MAG: hypothetical protein BWY86_01178 [Candidatus Aminicenantes bacterium ADurb.Bin508]